MTTPVDVLGYLHEKGLQTRRATGDEVHIPCIYCNEADGKRGRLYVNIDPNADIPGLHHCKLCDARGSIVTMQKHFGDATEKQEKEDRGYLRMAILAEAASYYHQALADNPPALHWLRADRGLSLDTIIEFQLGFADGGLFPHLRQLGFSIEDIAATGLTQIDRNTQRTVDFLHHITIPYFVAGNVVMIRGRAFGDDDPKAKYVTPPGQKTRLFNSDATWTAKEIFIAEGEFDALVLQQLGYAAVAAPGVSSWQDTWDGYFAQVRRVWVVYDRDVSDVGNKGAQKVLDHLGGKARQVELPPHDHGKSKNDITEYIVVCGHTRADFEMLLRASKGSLLTVDDAIAEHTSLQGQKGLKFGLPKLDLLIDPGLLASQVMVVIAKTSTGKTVMLLNMFQRICLAQPEKKVLFVSLEQTRGEWWERARRIYRFYHPGTTDKDVADFWRPRLFIDDRNRITEGQLLDLIEDFKYETGQKPDLIGVDYLGYWARSFKGMPYERTSDAIMSLKAIAKDQRIPIIVPHQVSRMTMHGTEPGLDSARDSGIVEETADFVLVLWSQDTLAGRTMDDRTGELKLKIVKSRHGGSGHIESLVFAPLTLGIVPSSEVKFAAWAANELYYQSAYTESWEDALIRHEAGTLKDVSDFVAVERALNRKRQGQLGR